MHPCEAWWRGGLPEVRAEGCPAAPPSFSVSILGRKQRLTSCRGAAPDPQVSCAQQPCGVSGCDPPLPASCRTPPGVLAEGRCPHQPRRQCQPQAGALLPRTVLCLCRLEARDQCLLWGTGREGAGKAQAGFLHARHCLSRLSQCL